MAIAGVREPAAMKELRVGARLRRRWKGIGTLEPGPTFPLVTTGDALGAGLVPGHAAVEAGSREWVDAEALHDAVHQLGLTKDPVQHRAPVAEIAHVAYSSAACSSVEGCGNRPFDPDQMRLRRIALTVRAWSEIGRDPYRGIDAIQSEAILL